MSTISISCEKGFVIRFQIEVTPIKITHKLNKRLPTASLKHCHSLTLSLPLTRNLSLLRGCKNIPKIADGCCFNKIYRFRKDEHVAICNNVL